MNTFQPSRILSLLMWLGGLTAFWPVWAGVTNTTPLRTFGMQPHVFDVAFSPDGAGVLTSGAYGEVMLWDAATGDKRVTFQGMDPNSTNRSSASLSGDGRYVLTAQADNRSVLLWDATTNRLRRAFTTLAANVGVYHAAISSNATHVATCESGTNTVRVWDGSTGRLIITLFGHTEGALHCAFSPDGTRLATSGNPIAAASPVRIWDVGTWQTRLTIPHRDQVHAVAYSPDGSRLVTVDLEGIEPEGVATVWNAATGLRLRQFPHGPTTVLAAEFAPDGTRVLTGSRDGCARLWDYESGDLVCTFVSEAGQGSDVPAVAISPDGRQVLTAHVAGFAVLWEVPQDVSLQATLTTKGAVVITWPPAAQDAGYILLQCPDLLGDWVEVQLIEPGRYEIPEAAETSLFFRLARFE